jgi:hypothetical protein
MSKTGPSTALATRRDTAIEAAGGNDALLELVAGGLGFREIAERIGLEGSEVNQAAIRRRLARQCPDDYEEAKRASVDAIAERAAEMYGTEAPTNSADAKWRNDRAGHLRWLAEIRGGRTQDGTVINVGQLHLDVLRAVGSMDHNPDYIRRRGPADPAGAFMAAEVIDAEVIEDGGK